MPDDLQNSTPHSLAEMCGTDYLSQLELFRVGPLPMEGAHSTMKAFNSFIHRGADCQLRDELYR
ncbi:MAG: hypothetical protein PVS2B2_11130 [Candidatus Acidiferrum sp.]